MRNSPVTVAYYTTDGESAPMQHVIIVREPDTIVITVCIEGDRQGWVTFDGVLDAIDFDGGSDPGCIEVGLRLYSTPVSRSQL